LCYYYLMEKKKVKICRDHLPEFFEAIKKGNLNLVKKLEHELAPKEECVACSYVFKARGSVREALADYLQKDGFEVETGGKETVIKQAFFWIFRLFIFALVFAALVLFEMSLRNFLLGLSFNFLKLNLFEYLVIGLASVIIFLLIDDNLLE